MSTGKVTVQERLAFAVRPEDVEVFIGMSATFNCMGKGDPGPSSLRWQFNGGDPLDGVSFVIFLVKSLNFDYKLSRYRYCYNEYKSYLSIMT